MRKVLTPLMAAVLVVAMMLYQARTVNPVLCEAPSVKLVEIKGFASEPIAISEAERTVLPADTEIDKRRYVSPDGEVLFSVGVGGRSKSSLPRPVVCLPARGFQMASPRTVEVGGVEWHVVTLARKEASSMGFAYTFFNQDGYRTSSHLRRIFRDVWDRSIRGRIDRWVMMTVHSSVSDETRLTAFLAKLKEVADR